MRLGWILERVRSAREIIQQSEHVNGGRLDRRDLLQSAGEVTLLEQSRCTLAMFVDQRVGAFKRGKGTMTAHITRSVAVIPLSKSAGMMIRQFISLQGRVPDRHVRQALLPHDVVGLGKPRNLVGKGKPGQLLQLPPGNALRYVELRGNTLDL